MKIGIDISQLAYPHTGVANYLQHLVIDMLEKDKGNQYVLFFSSLRGRLSPSFRALLNHQNVTLKEYKIPPSFLSILWNTLHMLPIEHFVGDVDIFISSDWTEPPVKRAKKVTILYDLIVYKFPEEMDKRIVNTQKMKLKWVKKECSKILCISQATKKDAESILSIENRKLEVIYPGI